MLPRLTDITDLRGRHVLLRASLNVPVQFGTVRNEFRIVRALPTLRYLHAHGARTIVVAHIGRKPEDSLEPVAQALSEHIPVSFVPAIEGAEVDEARAAMEDGDTILLENIRQHPREKDDDGSVAAALAHLADYYVNDAFAASHRPHASLVGVPRHLPSCFGINFMHEYEELTKAITPTAPSLFVLGGAKFETKLPLVERHLDHYSQIFIGGALANDFFKARGHEVGTSLVSDISLADSPLITDERILTPVDVVVDGPDGRRTCLPTEVQPSESILDAGPETIAMLGPHVRRAETILWNGPLGNYEAGYGQQTEALAHMIAAARGYAIIGGGDTIAAVEKLQLQERIGFMSTAGGAMLTFLETGTLPAIEAVTNKP
ncbi:MAG TPA: phosphoglycerate kinase [Candidatus Paceibacterota bacterium]|nr:phosphoglycerate kinase [Candidatus Paceibacterota bacterium]